MKCPSCTAPLPAGRARCSYCGSTADIDFTGKFCASAQPPAHPRTCCGCGHPMDTLDIGTSEAPFFVERCPACLGLFFDPGELEAIIDRDVPQVHGIDHLALSRLAELNGEPVHYRKCPICGKTMNRINYGKSSGVIADRCRDHGVYLDAGELRRIVAWVRAGGRLAAAEKAAEKKRASQAIEVPAPSLPGREEGDVAFPRIGTFLLKFLRDRLD
jgi:Zn-finger nucleic acid-binding protein